MQIAKKNLKKRAEKENKRKIKRELAFKRKQEKIERKNKIKDVFVERSKIIAEISMLKDQMKDNGEIATEIKVPENVLGIWKTFLEEDETIIGLKLSAWKEEDKEKYPEFDIDKDVAVC